MWKGLPVSTTLLWALTVYMPCFPFMLKDYGINNDYQRWESCSWENRIMAQTLHSLGTVKAVLSFIAKILLMGGYYCPHSAVSWIGLFFLRPSEPSQLFSEIFVFLELLENLLWSPSYFMQFTVSPESSSCLGLIFSVLEMKIYLMGEIPTDFTTHSSRGT